MRPLSKVHRDFRFIHLNDGLDPTTTLICLLPDPAISIKRVHFRAEYHPSHQHVTTRGQNEYELHLPIPDSVIDVKAQVPGRSWLTSPPFPTPETYFHRKIAQEGIGAAILALIAYAPGDYCTIQVDLYKRTKVQERVKHVRMSLNEAMLMATDHIGVHSKGAPFLDHYESLWHDAIDALQERGHKVPPPMEEGRVNRSTKPRTPPGAPGLSV